MDAIKIITDLINQKGITEQKFLQDLDLNKSSLGDWRKGTTTSYKKHIDKIADYFNVTVDFLLGRSSYPANATILEDGDIVMFPVYGSISAGYDKEGEILFDVDGDNEYQPVPKYLIKGLNMEDYFVLKIKGDSMYPRYFDGDNVLIHKVSSVDSGTIAAVGYNGNEATLKRVEYVGGEDWMKLVPINQKYAPMTIRGEDLEECRIYGKVVYLFRKES